MSFSTFEETGFIMVYSCDVAVPGNAVPLIIGKAGFNIQRLRDMFNVRMVFLGQNTETYEERYLRIMGLPKDVELARKKVDDITSGRDIEFVAFQPGADDVVAEFFIPNSVAQLVIGQNAENIKSLKASLDLSYLEQEGLRILDDGKEVRVLGIHGSIDRVEQAKIILHRLTDSFESKYRGEIVNGNGNGYLLDDYSTPCNVSSTTISSNLKAKQRENGSKSVDLSHFASNGSKSVDLSGSNGIIDDMYINTVPISANAPEIGRFAARLSEVNESLNTDFQRLRKEYYDMTLKLVLEFYGNIERDCNRAKSVFEMENKSNGKLILEIAELKKELETKDAKLDEMLVANDELRSAVEELTIELNKVEGPEANEPKCRKCCKELRDTILMPCLHLTHCLLCAKQLIVCPICNQKITSRLKVKLGNDTNCSD